MPATAAAFFEYSQYAFASYGIGLTEGPAVDNLDRLSGPQMMSLSQAEGFAQVTVFFGGGFTRTDVRVANSNSWGSMRLELPATGDVSGRSFVPDRHEGIRAGATA